MAPRSFQSSKELYLRAHDEGIGGGDAAFQSSKELYLRPRRHDRAIDQSDFPILKGTLSSIVDCCHRPPTNGLSNPQRNFIFLADVGGCDVPL